MKLEPVAWMTHESNMRLTDGGNCKGAVPVHQQRSHASSIPLYAIPEGYVVVPVEDVEDARLGRFVKNFDIQTLELTLDRMKYVFSHPEEFPVPPAKEQQ